MPNECVNGDSKCTSPNGSGGRDCWAGSDVEPCTCSSGKARVTGATTMYQGKRYYEYTCCTSEAHGKNVDYGECGDYKASCPAGKYKAPNGCEHCTPGTFSPTTSRATSCSPCQIGRYSGVQATSCISCPAGKFSWDPAAPCSDCAAGKYSSAGSGVCDDCGAGRYSGKGVSTCTGCAAGKYLVNRQTDEEASACAICSSGTYSTQAVNSCTSCGAGKYISDDQNDASKHDNEDDCLECENGKYSSAAGSDQCLKCEGGKYSDAGSPACDDCGEGQYSAEGSPSCASCTAGKYLSNSAVGVEASACSICTSGTYSTQAVNSCTSCGAGKYISDDQTDASKHDNEDDCLECEKGKYSSAAGSDQCLKCEGGKYSDAGSPACDDCGEGQYSAEGSPSCASCTAGKYLSNSAVGVEASACSICTSGTYSTQAVNSCTSCSAGKYISDHQTDASKHDNEDDCFDCESGKFSLVGSQNCADCAKGTYSDAGSEACINCGAGRYSGKGVSACTGCAAGKYLVNRETDEEASACAICSSGTYSTQAVNSCSMCAAGRYGASPGATNSSVCIECDFGKMSHEGAPFCKWSHLFYAAAIASTLLLSLCTCFCCVVLIKTIKWSPNRSSSGTITPRTELELRSMSEPPTVMLGGAGMSEDYYHNIRHKQKMGMNMNGIEAVVCSTGVDLSFEATSNYGPLEPSADSRAYAASAPPEPSADSRAYAASAPPAPMYTNANLKDPGSDTLPIADALVVTARDDDEMIVKL